MTYSPNEVARAAGIDLSTLQSWLARKYIVVKSQGAGRAREFTLAQAVRIAVMRELSHKLSVTISAAAAMSAIVQLPIADRGDFLIAGGFAFSAIIHRDIGQSIEDAVGFRKLASYILLDVSKVASRTSYLLNHPNHPFNKSIERNAA